MRKVAEKQNWLSLMLKIAVCIKSFHVVISFISCLYKIFYFVTFWLKIGNQFYLFIFFSFLSDQSWISTWMTQSKMGSIVPLNVTLNKLHGCPCKLSSTINMVKIFSKREEWVLMESCNFHSRWILKSCIIPSLNVNIILTSALCIGITFNDVIFYILLLKTIPVKIPFSSFFIYDLIKMWFHKQWDLKICFIIPGFVLCT